MKWINKTGPNNATYIASSATGKTLLVANIPKPYLSTNYGLTFTELSSFPNGTWQYASISADGTKMIVLNGDAPFEIYYSEDSGVNWSNIDGSIAGLHDKLAIVSDNGNVGVLVKIFADNYTVRKFAYTNDQGSNWVISDITTHDVMSNSMACNTVDMSNIIISDYIYDYWYTSTDYGATWTQHGTGSSNIQQLKCACSVDGLKMAVIARDILSNKGKLSLSNNGGNTWKTIDMIKVDRQISMSANGDTLLFVEVGNPLLLISYDFGYTFVEVPNDYATCLQVICCGVDTKKALIYYDGVSTKVAVFGCVETPRRPIVIMM